METVLSFHLHVSSGDQTLVAMLAQQAPLPADLRAPFFNAVKKRELRRFLEFLFHLFTEHSRLFPENIADTRDIKVFLLKDSWGMAVPLRVRVGCPES